MNIVQELENLLSTEADDFTISKTFKEAIKEYKESLQELFETSGGKDFLVKHTKNIDLIITLMYKTVLRKFFGNYLPMRNSIPIAFIALGSYGREQLALYSDIDLMIVYEEIPGYNIQDIIKAFLHIAWDAKLDLGHRVHEINDLLKASQEDITIKSALIESRFITGSTFAWHNTQRKIDSIRRDNPKAFVKAKLEEAILRRKKYPRSMQPHIKEGVGGLRDAHLLSWVAFINYGVRTLRELSGTLFSEDEYREYRIALEFLYKVRSALHMAQGKKQDTLILELIPQVSQLLNFADQKSFVSKTLQAMHTINLFTEIILTKMTRKFFPCNDYHKLRSSYLDEGIFLIDNTLHASFQHKGIPLLNFLQLLQKTPDAPLEFNPSFLRVVSKLTIPTELDTQLHQAFYALFKRRFTAPFLHLLYNAQVLGKIFPPLQKVHFLAQFDGYHHYPVTIHSIMCVQELENIEDESILQLFMQLSDEEKQFLKLVIFMHDAGKGRVQDHSEVGARLFNHYAAQLDISQEQLAIGIMLIKNHTFMSNVAFREDIYNEKVLFKFMSVVGSQKALDMLFILTYADISGVGPDTFTPFNSRLLHQLYSSATDVIDQQDRLTEAAKRLKKEKTLQKSKEFIALPKVRQKKILAIESNLFFIKHSSSEILELAKKAVDIKDYRYYITNENHLRIEIYRKIPINIAYLLSKLTFLPIVTMDIFKLYNEMKYFRIDFSEAVDESDLAFIEEIIQKSFDMEKRVKLPAVTIKPNEITLDCEHSKSYANMQIHTQDQKGLLGFIMTVFEELGVDIATAKIYTIKKRARDQFLIEKTDSLCQNASEIIEALTQEGNAK